MNENESYSHPEAPVRHSYPLAIESWRVMTKFHVAVRNQSINLEWDQRLTSLNGKFRDLKDKAASGWAPSIPPIPSGVPPSGQ